MIISQSETIINATFLMTNDVLLFSSFLMSFPSFLSLVHLSVKTGHSCHFLFLFYCLVLYSHNGIKNQYSHSEN